MDKFMRQAVGGLLENLSARERTILDLRFGFTQPAEPSLEAIGKIMGVTRERVRQIESEALKTLRDPKISRRVAAFAYSGEDSPPKTTRVIESLQSGPPKYSLTELPSNFFPKEGWRKLDPTLVESLEKIDVRGLADFFINSPAKLFEDWIGKGFEVDNFHRAMDQIIGPFASFQFNPELVAGGQKDFLVYVTDRMATDKMVLSKRLGYAITEERMDLFKLALVDWARFRYNYDRVLNCYEDIDGFYLRFDYDYWRSKIIDKYIMVGYESSY